MRAGASAAPNIPAWVARRPSWIFAFQIVGPSAFVALCFCRWAWRLGRGGYGGEVLVNENLAWVLHLEVPQSDRPSWSSAPPHFLPDIHDPAVAHVRDGTHPQSAGDAAGRGSGCPAQGPGRHKRNAAVGPPPQGQHQGDTEASPRLPLPPPPHSWAGLGQGLGKGFQGWGVRGN